MAAEWLQTRVKTHADMSYQHLYIAICPCRQSQNRQAGLGWLSSATGQVIHGGRPCPYSCPGLDFAQRHSAHWLPDPATQITIVRLGLSDWGVGRACLDGGAGLGAVGRQAQAPATICLALHRSHKGWLHLRMRIVQESLRQTRIAANRAARAEALTSALARPALTGSISELRTIALLCKPLSLASSRSVEQTAAKSYCKKPHGPLSWPCEGRTGKGWPLPRIE